MMDRFVQTVQQVEAAVLPTRQAPEEKQNESVNDKTGLSFGLRLPLLCDGDCPKATLMGN